MAVKGEVSSPVPTFSVVIATYQRGAEVACAVRSVLAQTYSSFEVIIVDDGSTDGTARTLDAFRDDSRVRIVRQDNQGRTAARNKGSRLARGDMLTFLDSDDQVERHWLEAFETSFSSADVAVVCCGAKIHVDRPDVGVEREFVRLPANLGPVYDHVVGLFLTGTYAIRREVFEELGGYDEGLAFSENTDLLHRLVPYLRRRELRIEIVRQPLLAIINRRPAVDCVTAQQRLHAARVIVERHGQQYWRHSRAGYANYCRIASVNAARLRHRAEAWRWARCAAIAEPWNWKNHVQIARSLFGLSRVC